MKHPGRKYKYHFFRLRQVTMQSDFCFPSTSPSPNHHPSKMATLRETITKTLNVFLAGYVDGAKDATKLSTVLTPDCLRTFAPLTFLNAIGAPADVALDNKTYEDFYAAELPVAWGKSLDEVANVVIDVEARTAAATTVYTNEFSDGEEFRFEFAWFLKFNQDGTAIERVLEWVDSVGTARYHAKIGELKGKAPGKE